MVIAIVVDLVDNKTNGSVITALRFANGLRARGHEVRMVAIGADGENDCPVKERYVPILTEVSALNQIKFGKYDEKRIKKTFEGVDLVHFIFPFKLEKKCKQLADRMGIPTTAAFHVQPENVSYNAHLSWCKPFNSLVYAYFKQTFFVPAEKTNKNDKFEIIMTGRLAPEKNQQVLIKAIGLSKHREDIHLTLLGNGPKKAMLKKLAERLNVDLTFDFLPKERLIKKLQSGDLYVHAATVEIEAIACLEAVACGLVPVIADSKCSATPQFALDRRSLFEDNNEYSLVEKIDYWFERDDERMRMGKVYAESAKKYSLDKSLEKAERMFADEIMDNKARSEENFSFRPVMQNN